jgi:endonuclease/exonuclease/phosphatase (EEP) superfamily protein YafD
VEVKSAVGKGIAEDPAETKPEKKPGSGWSGIVSGLVLGVLGIAATRLGYLWPEFDVISALTPHFLFLILACLLAAIIPRWKNLAAIVVLIVCIVIYGAYPLMQRAPPPAPLLAGEITLRIAHYNSHASNKDLVAIEREIRALQADVIVLLELTKDKLPAYDTLRSDYPYIHTCIGQGKCQTAIISRFPFAEVNPVAHSDSPPNISVKLGAAQQAVTIVGVHTQRIPNLARQNEHIRNLAKLLEPLTGHVILTGDFNTTPYSRALSDFELSTGLQRQTSLPTWPANLLLPQFSIDHIFLTSKIKVRVPPRAGGSGGSDHLPLVMEVALPPP